VAVNPTTDLGLPTAGSRDRAATPEQAAELLNALPEDVRPLWACAFYAGLRRGELRGLQTPHVDLAAATIDVVRSWDDKEGEIEPKSRAGTRRVFLLDALRPYLEPNLSHRFVFGSELSPFDARAVARKADRALDA